MAVTPLTVFDPALSGTVITMTTPTGTGLPNGVSFANDGQTVFMVISAAAGATVPTFDATGTLGGVQLTDPTGSVANDSVPKVFGPFDRSAFGSTVAVGFSVATGVTCAAIRMPRV